MNNHQLFESQQLHLEVKGTESRGITWCLRRHRSVVFITGTGLVGSDLDSLNNSVSFLGTQNTSNHGLKEKSVIYTGFIGSFCQ